MVIISYRQLRDYFHRHAEVKEALNAWYAIVDSSDWTNYHEMKRAFGSVDAVGNDRYVFNIKGNKFRLIAMIFFNRRTVYIRFIGTHPEYDRIKANEA